MFCPNNYSRLVIRTIFTTSIAGSTGIRIVGRATGIITSTCRFIIVSRCVVIRAIIGVDGLVRDAKLLKGTNGGFDQAALAAVRDRVYSPGLLDGRPVEVISTIRIEFKLEPGTAVLKELRQGNKGRR